MNFLLGTEEAKELVSSIFDIVPSNTTLNYSPAVRISAEDSVVSFYFGDSGIYASNFTPAEIKSSGNIQVELKTLYKVLTSFPAFKNGDGVESVRFSVDGFNLNVKATCVYKTRKVRQSRTLQAYDVVMPNINLSDCQEFIHIPMNSFFEAIKKILVSLPTSSGVGGSSGVYFCVDENYFKLVSTDGPTLTECKSEIRGNKNGVSCVLPSSFVAKLGRLLSRYSCSANDEESVEISIENRIFKLKFRNIEVGSSIVNDGFPDYEKIFLATEKKVTIQSNIFLDNISNISYSADVKDNFRLNIKSLGDELVLSTGSCVNEGIPIIGDSIFSVEFNANILEKCIRNLGAEEFCLLFKGKHLPSIFIPVDGSFDVRTAIAPLR